MKKSFTYTFAVIFALYFMAAGTGCNIFRFCCNNCKSQGIEAVIGEKCKTTCAQKPACCAMMGNSEMPHNCVQTEEHCSVIRLAVETPVTENSSETVKISQTQIFLFCSCGAPLCDCTFAKAAHQSRLICKIPFAITGRQVLAEKSLLLI